jgi:hypothetical protein
MKAIIGDYKYRYEDERYLAYLYHEVRHNTVRRYMSSNNHDLRRYLSECVHELVSLYDYPRFIENLGGKAMYQKRILKSPGYETFVNLFRREIIDKYSLDEKVLVIKLMDYENVNPTMTPNRVVKAICDIKPSLKREERKIEEWIESIFQKKTMDYVTRNNIQP